MQRNKRLLPVSVSVAVTILILIFGRFSLSTVLANSTCTVGVDEITIQAALDNMACQTIQLQATSYAETLIIQRDVEIRGVSVDESIIDGSDLNSVVRIIFAPTVTLTNITIQNGVAPSTGGGIQHSGGELHLKNVAVRSNSAQQGGGGIYSRGSVHLANSVVSANSSHTGGGLYNGGDLTVVRSEISNNNASSVGGGIYNESGRTVNLKRSGMSRNVSDKGGAIYNVGIFELDQSSIISNRAERFGGGVYNEGEFVAVNSTLSGNQATRSVGRGGGVYAAARQIKLINTTVYNNSAENSGGGLYVGLQASSTMSNSIVANSTSGDCMVDGPQFFSHSAPNFDSDGSCGAAFTGDPLLKPLAGSGILQYHEPFENSLVINSADDAICIGARVSSVDQRDSFRPMGASCDLGSIEFADTLAVGLGQQAITGIAPSTLAFVVGAFMLLGAITTAMQRTRGSRLSPVPTRFSSQHLQANQRHDHR